MFYNAMEGKVAKGEEKRLHDPLAAMCKIEEGIVSLVDVVASGGKEWGATRINHYDTTIYQPSHHAFYFKKCTYCDK